MNDTKPTLEEYVKSLFAKGMSIREIYEKINNETKYSIDYSEIEEVIESMKDE